MGRLKVNALKEQDVVLVQGHVLHYCMTAKDAPNDVRFGPWSAWKSLFGLQSFALLRTLTPDFQI